MTPIEAWLVEAQATNDKDLDLNPHSTRQAISIIKNFKRAAKESIALLTEDYFENWDEACSRLESALDFKP